MSNSKLSSIIEELDLKIDTLADRKLLQKQIYLLQKLGVDLGYDFGFYIYGPYSSDLTRDAFYFFEQKEHAPKTISREPLSKEEVDAIGKVNEIRMNISPERRADELELMTSILFLKSLPYLKLESFDLIYEEIQKKKPNRFNKELVEKYYKKINEISFKN